MVFYQLSLKKRAHTDNVESVETEFAALVGSRCKQKVYMSSCNDPLLLKVGNIGETWVSTREYCRAHKSLKHLNYVMSSQVLKPRLELFEVVKL